MTTKRKPNNPNPGNSPIKLSVPEMLSLGEYVLNIQLRKKENKDLTAAYIKRIIDEGVGVRGLSERVFEAEDFAEASRRLTEATERKRKGLPQPEDEDEFVPGNGPGPKDNDLTMDARNLNGGPFSGHRLYLTGRGNHRVKIHGKRISHGWKSVEIIRKNPGILYHDYLAKGGRYRDLWHDIRKGKARAEVDEEAAAENKRQREASKAARKRAGVPFGWTKGAG